MKVAIFGAVLLVMGACGGELVLGSSTGGDGGATSAGGLGGATASSTDTTASTGGGGHGGGGGTSTTVGGGGFGGAGCPDLGCAFPCPLGDYWLEDDGCPSCACACSLSFPAAPNDLHTSLTASISETPDRYVLHFVWLYDDPVTSDEEVWLDTEVELLRDPVSFEPTAEKVTWFLPEHADAPLIGKPGVLVMGFWMPGQTLLPNDGFLSIRRIGNTFDGYVRLNMSGLVVSSPFTAVLP